MNTSSENKSMGRRATSARRPVETQMEVHVPLGAAGARGYSDERPGARAVRPTHPLELSRGASVGRYLILHTLGAGGMGVVYLAYDPELDRKVALKLLRSRGGEQDESAGHVRLLREAQALAKLSHPNVVGVHDAGVHDGKVWLAMEFVSGQSLRAWAGEQAPRWPQGLRVLTEIAQGVAAAHAAGLVHRDLKPENVIIGDDGRVRVMDFGLAHGRMGGAELDRAAPAADVETRPDVAALAVRLTRTGAVQGTPEYMAPEQWRGEEATGAADQFAWSVMAWELCCGERPFAGETPAELAANVLSGRRRPSRGRGVPGWLQRVLERGTAVDPAARWGTMEGLLDALRRARIRARLGKVLLIIAVVAAIGGALELGRRWSLEQRVAACRPAGDSIDPIWNDEVEENIRRAFAATGMDADFSTASFATSRLSMVVRDWKQARVRACEKAEVYREWDDQSLDHALWCLDVRKTNVAALAEVFSEADVRVVQKASELLESAPDEVDKCLDGGVYWLFPRTARRDRDMALRSLTEIASAELLQKLKKFDRGLILARQAYERAKKCDSEPALMTFSTMALYTLRSLILDQANSHMANGEFAEAQVVFAATLSMDERLRTAMDMPWMVVDSLNRLADAYMREGSFSRAQLIYERVLRLQDEEFHLPYLGKGSDEKIYVQMGTTLSNLGEAYLASRRYPEAWAAFGRSLHIRASKFGDSSTFVAQSLSGLARVRLGEGRYWDALPIFERAVAMYEAREDVQQGESAARFGLARALIATGGNRRRALEEAERARNRYREVGKRWRRELAEVEAWIAENEP